MEDPEFELGPEKMKKTLQKENRLYKTALDHEVEELKDQAKELGKMALIAGGAVLGAYLLVKLFKKSDDEEKELPSSDKRLLNSPNAQVVVERPRKENSFASMLKEQLAMLVVSVVTEKISELTNVEKKRVEEKKNEFTGKPKHKD